MAIDTEEVALSVAKIVPGFVRYQYGALGTRALDRSYSDFRNGVLGALLTRDGAPFYIVKLARDRLVKYIEQVRTTAEALQGACTGAARRVQPVSRTSSLSNARVALEALAKSTAERTGVYQSIATIPTFRRFENNLNQFLSEEGKKANYRGELTDTPAQAQAKIRPLAMQLRGEWDELLRLTALWATSVDVYMSMNLPATLSQVIMENAGTLLGDRIEELNAMTPEERLTVLRELVVDVIAVKTTVKNFGSLEPPTTFILLEGVGGVYADSTHAANAATLPSDFPSGYSVYLGQDTLQLLVDGTHSLTINPPGSYIARHDCQTRGPFEVTAGMDLLRLSYERNLTTTVATTTEDVTLPNGSAVQPWEIAGAVTAQTTQALGGLYMAIPKTTQEADIVMVDGNTANFTLINGLLWADLGVVSGDKLVVDDTDSSYNYTAWDVTSVSGATITCDLLQGTVVADEGAINVSVGEDQYIRFFITLRQTSTALTYRTALQLLDGEEGTCASIGLYATSKMYTHRTPASTFADWVNKSTSAASVDGTPRLSASAELEDLHIYTSARTHTEDALLVSFYIFRGEVTIVSASGGSTVLENADLAAAVSFGHIVAFRGTSSSDDTNTWGLVTGISGSQVTVNHQITGTGTALVESGRALFSYTNVRRELELVVNDDTENNGRYPVSADPCVDPLTLRLLRAFPSYIGLGGQPVLLAEVQLCRYVVVLKSLNTLLASSIRVLGTGNFDDNFVTPTPKTVVGTTSWFQLPSIPRRLEPGDYLEVHNVDPITPSVVSKVISIDSSNKLIELETPLPVDQATVNFSVTNVLPFARLRKAVKQNFDEVSGNLKTWLELPNIVPLRMFRSLDAALNPVVANSPPSMAQANLPKVILDITLAQLDELEAYLNVYDADVVTEVDSLIKGYTQKGMDRAIDVLLSGDFSTFFGLSMDTSSYSGNLQYALREVQKGDYPVRKDNRNNSVDAVEEQTIATFDDVDFEYNPDQLDTNQRIDTVEPNSPSFDLPL